MPGAMSRPHPPDRRRTCLFRRPDGTPIDFHLGGVPYSERQRLAELVTAHGGVVVVNPGRHPHSVSIELGEPGSRQRPAISIQADVFSSRFLEDCIQQGRLVPLAGYRLQSTSVYSQPSRADEVMLGRVTWTQLAAVAFPASLEDEEELNEDERLLAVNEEEDTTSSGRGAGPYRGRLKFNRAKDEALIAFVAKYGRQRYAPPTGPKFWHMKKFLLPEILAKHPPLSLHTHFIKQVKPRLADFKCTMPLEVVARAAEAASADLDLTEAERRQMAEADERESRRAQERLAKEREEREERIRAERERVRARRDERLREERERERRGDGGEAEAGAGTSAAAAAPEATAGRAPALAAAAQVANTASTATADPATTATDTANSATALSQDNAAAARQDNARQDPARQDAAPATAADPPAAASAASQRTTRQHRQDGAAAATTAAAAEDAASEDAASQDSDATNMSSSESHISASQSDHSDGDGGGGGRVPMLSRHVSSNHSDELGDSDETVEIPPQIRQSMTARLSAILSQSGGAGEENYSPILPSQAQPKKRAQRKRPARLLDSSDEESVVSVGPRSSRRAAGAVGMAGGAEAHAAWASVAEELHGRVSVTPNEDGTVTVTVIGTPQKDQESRATEKDAGDSAAAPRQSPRKGAKRTAAASPEKRGTAPTSPQRREASGTSPQRRGAATRSPEKRGSRRAAAVRANDSLSPAYGGTLLDGHGTERETRAGDMMKFLRNFRLRREKRSEKNRAESGVEASAPAAAATGKDGGSPTRRGLRSAATTATTAAATAGVDTPRSPSESSAVSVDISPTVKLTRVDAENAATSNGATGGCDRPAPRGAGAGTPEPEQRSAPAAAEAAGTEGAGLDRTRASSSRRRLYDHDTPGRILEVSPQNRTESRAEPRGEPRGAMPTPGAAPTATSTQTTPPRRPKPLADWLRDHSISTPEAVSVEDFPPLRLDRHTRAATASAAAAVAAAGADGNDDDDDEGRARGHRIPADRAAAADNRRTAAESRAAESRAAADRQEAGPSRLPGKRRRRRRAPSPDAEKDSSSDSEAGSVDGPLKRRAARRARTNIAATINSTNSFTNGAANIATNAAAVSSTTTNAGGVGGKRSRPLVVQKKPNGRPVGCNARPYTPEEDRVLWTQIEAIEAAGGLLGGNVVWKKMERTRVIPGRSWQSLKQRWRLLSHRV